MSTRAIRRFQFCAGHRVHRHESKCNNMHGHNYIINVTAIAPKLDSLGRVMDFGEIKARILPWIDANWDHGFIVYKQDMEVLQALKTLPSQKIYCMNSNPTAENMALHLLRDICPLLFSGTDIVISEIELFETENCSVVVRLGEEGCDA